MGRKNKKHGTLEGTASGGGRSVMSQHNKREVMELVTSLLEKCSGPLRSGSQEWQDFLLIYELIEKLQRKQQAYVMKPFKRENHFGDFMSWLKENKVDTETISIANFEKEGFGLKATRDVNMGELFLTVPRKVMMTTQTAQTSKLGFLMEVDRVLKGMPNVVLSLHLLTERASPDSFWMPYIKTLPSSYSTALYFKPEEIQLLKGSPVYSDILNQWKNIARQYSYFYTLFHKNAEAGKLPIKDFCFDDYRWAVSTVMTRQNQIPSTQGSQVVNALIPLWDMCNHCNGQITTDFNVEADCSECYALRNFPKESQVFIFYGSRSNAELFLHSGFVYPNNQSDRISIKLGVSKNDPLYSLKSELLARLNLLPSRLFYIHTGEDPIDSDLLAFLRVFAMDEASLRERLTGENAGKLQRSLRDFGEVISVDNEKRAWQFLETRISLLLRAYPTTSEEDGAQLETLDLAENARLAIQLRRCEKRILMTAQEYAHKYGEQVKQAEEPAPAGDTDLIESSSVEDKSTTSDENAAVEALSEDMSKMNMTGNCADK